MMKRLQQTAIVALFGSLLISGGCSLGGKKVTKSVETLSMPPVTMSTTKNMADVPDRCGNEPVYTLNGKTYQVLKSAAGYRAEGMASWYGAEFQGSKTAGCETFDMHGFTAAHRTLPLPSIVRVKNLQNGKSVIVRVNDRGPFENNGLIQLSFAAANTLGMTSGNRMAKVRVEALAGNRAGAAAVPRPQRVRPVKRPDPAQAAAIRQAKRGGKSFFVVVQNYQDQLEALEMFGRLTSVGLNKTELASAMSRGQKVHQVRIGPLYTQDQIDNVRDTLENNGLATFRVVEVDQ